MVHLSEIRIVMPFTVEEFKRGQRYGNWKTNENAQEPGQGGTLLSSTPYYHEVYGEGMFTHSLFRLGNRLPEWVSTAPRHAYNSAVGNCRITENRVVASDGAALHALLDKRFVLCCVCWRARLRRFIICSTVDSCRAVGISSHPLQSRLIVRSLDLRNRGAVLCSCHPPHPLPCRLNPRSLHRPLLSGCLRLVAGGPTCATECTGRGREELDLVPVHAHSDHDPVLQPPQDGDRVHSSRR